MTAQKSTQDESNFTEVRNKRKRHRKQMPTPINNVRPMSVSIDLRPSQNSVCKSNQVEFSSPQDTANKKTEEHFRIIYSTKKTLLQENA